MNDKVTVIIPAWNEEAYIAACLHALHVQTYKNFEIIVVDNNSTDNTSGIAKKLGVRVVREKIQGMTPARERGFEEAKTEIIARTDADTVVPPDWLERLVRALEHDPNLVGVSGGLDTPDPKKYPRFIFQLYNFLYNNLTRILTGHYHLMGPNMAIRKSAWKKIHVHRNDKLIHEDVDLACHLATVGSIGMLSDLNVPYSVRRVTKNPFHMMIDYPRRYIHTLLLHR